VSADHGGFMRSAWVMLGSIRVSEDLVDHHAGVLATLQSKSHVVTVAA